MSVDVISHAVWHSTWLSDTCQAACLRASLFFGAHDIIQDPLFYVGQVAPIVRLIPIIIRLFPDLVKLTFYRGSVVVANRVTPMSETELERAVNAQVKTQDPRDAAKDAQMVVKVSDAIKCLETTFNSTTLIKEFILVACKSLLEGVQKKACGQEMFNRMSRCIREHALRQDTPRSAHRTTSHGRPARGHGHGR